MGEGLPKLPGFSFSDKTRTNFRLTNFFDFTHGYRRCHNKFYGPGNTLLDAFSVGFIEKPDTTSYDPSLTYGRSRSQALPQFVPRYALYANKCLTFKAFFKQSVVGYPNDPIRIRFVNILYFLEDDTITVMEPPIPDVGFPQGKFLKRGKIPKSNSGDFWHWKDFNIGVDLSFYGTVFHTIDCDLFTREFMRSEGIFMNPTEDTPPDPYIHNRTMANMTQSRVTPIVDDKLRRYLEYDGKVLRFYAVWDDRESECGELREHIIYYFLADDTISLKEIHKTNDGKDPFPLLLKKMKIPKDFQDLPKDHPFCYSELTDEDITEYYQPKDLLVGETIFILGRRLLIYDCDKFTRNYYKIALNIEQKPGFDVSAPKPPPVQKQIPPLLPGQGDLLDSLGFCLKINPKPPKVDNLKQLLNANKYLRYLAEMVSSHPEDSVRKFILLFCLADDTIQIFEPAIRNSGIWGGKFLKRQVVYKPGSDPICPAYYTPADFFIGALIYVHKHVFRITGADLYVYRYISDNTDKFPQTVIDNIRNFMYKEGFLGGDLRDNVEQVTQQENLKQLIADIPEKEKVKSPTETCIDYFQNATTETPEPLKSMLDESDRTQYPRNESTHVPTERYGIHSAQNTCRYSPYIPEEKVEGTDCGVIRYTPDPPCCLNKDCPDKERIEDKSLREDLYYQDLLRRHNDLSKRIESYYCQPCLKDICPRPNIENSENNSKQRKIVTFADNPYDPCAYNKDDLCKLSIKKDHKDCTFYPGY